MEDQQDKPPFTAVPSHLQLGSNPSSPAGDTRCSTPTLCLVGGPVAVNTAVKELALELLKVRNRLRRPKTVFDTCVSFIFSSKTLDPLVFENGNKLISNTNFGF